MHADEGRRIRSYLSGKAQCHKQLDRWGEPTCSISLDNAITLVIKLLTPLRLGNSLHCYGLFTARRRRVARATKFAFRHRPPRQLTWNASDVTHVAVTLNYQSQYKQGAQLSHCAVDASQTRIDIYISYDCTSGCCARVSGYERAVNRSTILYCSHDSLENPQQVSGKTLFDMSLVARNLRDV